MKLFKTLSGGIPVQQAVNAKPARKMSQAAQSLPSNLSHAQDLFQPAFGKVKEHNPDSSSFQLIPLNQEALPDLTRVFLGTYHSKKYEHKYADYIDEGNAFLVRDHSRGNKAYGILVQSHDNPEYVRARWRRDCQDNDINFYEPLFRQFEKRAREMGKKKLIIQVEPHPDSNILWRGRGFSPIDIKNVPGDLSWGPHPFYYKDV